MKRILSLLACIVMALTLVFAFSSCDLINDLLGGNDIPPESEHTHDYTLTSDSATCTEDGVKTLTCECGDFYEQPSAAKGHDFDGLTCKNCGAEADPTSYTIYFRDTESWGNAYVYVWYTEGKGTEEAVTTNYTGSWPGAAMTKVEGSEDWYSYTIEMVAIEGIQLIFNNGQSSQSADLDFNTKKLYWANGACFATKTDAEADQGTVYSDWYLRGSNNNWGTGNRFVVDANGNSVLTIELAKGVNFKLADAGWTTEIDYTNAAFTADANFDWGTDSNNIQVVNEGTYTFTIDAAGNVTITKN